jgi:2-methylisocitrate lyase-like PEP mutase family enzyme
MLPVLEAAGRGPDTFAFGGQVAAGTDAASRAEALRQARAFVGAGADHVVLGIPASAGPDVLRALAREVAEPLRGAW